MSEETKNSWFQMLQDKINTLSEQFGLDDGQTNQFRDFVIKLARDQYTNGSKSGAGWAFAKAKAEQAAKSS